MRFSNSKQIKLPEYPLSKSQDRLFRRAIRTMPVGLRFKIAEQYEIEVPSDMNVYEMTQFIIEELSDNAKKEVVSIYGDAGKSICHYFSCEETIPDLQTLQNNAKAIFYPQEEERLGLEHFPYFSDIEIHRSSKTLRIRFHYIRGIYSYFDEETGSIKEQRRVFPGVIVFRPNTSILEVRTKHFSMARKVAVRTARMKLQPFFPVDLREEKYIKKFLDWIYSLNNARIDLPIRDTRSSIIIAARHGRDLRKLQEFRKELKRGRLRGGHVTIEKEKGYMIRFNIFFKPCHTWFTFFSRDDDIELVVRALERIMEGYEFVSPDKLLEEYFR